MFRGLKSERLRQTVELVTVVERKHLHRALFLWRQNVSNYGQYADREPGRGNDDVEGKLVGAFRHTVFGRLHLEEQMTEPVKDVEFDDGEVVLTSTCKCCKTRQIVNEDLHCIVCGCRL